MRCLIMLLTLALPAALLAQDTDTPPPATTAKVRVCGLKVVTAGYGDPKDWNNSLRPLNSGPGVEVALLLMPSRGKVIGFDDKASSVALFADDKGGDLGAKKPGENAWGNDKTRFGGFPKTSKDGKALMLSISTGKIPNPEATMLRLQGAIALQIATGQKDHKLADQALKTGTVLKAGELTLTLKDVKADGGNTTFDLAYTIPANGDPIASITFMNGDAKVKGDRRGSMTMGGTKRTVSWRLEGFKGDKITFVITTHTGLETISVPYQKTIQLGLGK